MPRKPDAGARLAALKRRFRRPQTAHERRRDGAWAKAWPLGLLSPLAGLPLRRTRHGCPRPPPLPDAFCRRMARRWYRMARHSSGWSAFWSEYYRAREAWRWTEYPARRFVELEDYATALRWYVKGAIEGAGFAAALDVAKGPNYLGDIEVVHRFALDWAQAVVMWLQDIDRLDFDQVDPPHSGARDRIIQVLSGQARDVTPLPGWLCSPLFKAAIAKHLLTGTSHHDRGEEPLPILVERAVDVLEQAVRHAFLGKYAAIDHAAAEQYRREAGDLQSFMDLSYFVVMARVPARLDAGDRLMVARYCRYFAAVMAGWPVTGTLDELVRLTAP